MHHSAGWSALRWRKPLSDLQFLWQKPTQTTKSAHHAGWSVSGAADATTGGSNPRKSRNVIRSGSQQLRRQHARRQIQRRFVDTLWMSLRSGSLHSAPPLCIGQRPDRRSEDDRNAPKWTAREARAVGSRTGRGQDRANHPQDGAGRSPSGGEAFHWGGQADAPRPVHRDYSTTHSTKQQCEVSRSRGR